MHYCKVELLFRNITVIRILQKKNKLSAIDNIILFLEM